MCSKCACGLRRCSPKPGSRRAIPEQPLQTRQGHSRPMSADPSHAALRRAAARPRRRRRAAGHRVRAVGARPAVAQLRVQAAGHAVRHRVGRARAAATTAWSSAGSSSASCSRWPATSRCCGPCRAFSSGLVAFLLGHLSLPGRADAAREVPRQPGRRSACGRSSRPACWPGCGPACRRELRAPVIVYVCALARDGGAGDVGVARAPRPAPTPRAGAPSPSAARCSCCPTRSSPPTSSSAACRCPRCGTCPSTGSRNGSSPARPSRPCRIETPMSMPMPTEGRASLARSYRNLSEREIRARLDGPMSRGRARHRQGRTAAPQRRRRRRPTPRSPPASSRPARWTSAPPRASAPSPADAAVGAPAPRRAWPGCAAGGGVAGGLGWAIHARPIRL